MHNAESMETPQNKEPSMIAISTPSISTPYWQAEKHLASEDRVWILTDVQTFHSSYYAFSDAQELFRVGIYDLKTKHVGLAHFGRDIARAFLRAGATPPPWIAPMPFGLALHRRYHDNNEEKGRYAVRVERIAIDPALLTILPQARAMLDGTEHRPDSTPGMWADLAARAAQENAIEKAALSKTVWFSAGDIRKAIGDPDADVTPMLKKLVREGKLLPPTGKKRGTKYRAA
jgi:hypothetical protein